MKKIVFVSLSIIALFIFTQVNVLACSCPTVGTMYPTKDTWTSIKLGRVQVAFSGEVVSITKIPKRMLTVKIQVQESWKQVLPEEVTIITELATCGYDFRVGTEYLIFAQGSGEGNLTTGLCLGNKELYKAAEELQVLGEGKKPQKKKSKIS